MILISTVFRKRGIAKSSEIASLRDCALKPGPNDRRRTGIVPYSRTGRCALQVPCVLSTGETRFQTEPAG